MNTVLHGWAAVWSLATATFNGIRLNADGDIRCFEEKRLKRYFGEWSYMKQAALAGGATANAGYRFVRYGERDHVRLVGAAYAGTFGAQRATLQNTHTFRA